MDSDDDYQQFSLPEEPSSPVHQRKLKRLKKATRVSSDVPISQPIDPIPSPDTPNSPKISDQESFEALEVENAADSVPNVLESEGFDGGRDVDNELDDLFVYRGRSEDQATFDVVGEEEVPFAEKEIDGKGDDVGDKFGDEKEQKWEIKRKKRSSLTKEGNEKKKGKKRGKSVDEKGNTEPPARTKRKLEKERKAYLEQLHAESQRLLRETRDAAFKPVPLVQKPISSILEKIRQRKLEVSKKASMLHNHDEANEFSKEVVIDLYPEEVRNDNSGDTEYKEEGDKDVPMMHAESNDADVTLVEISKDPAIDRSPVNKSIVGHKEHEEELERDKHLASDENNADAIHIETPSEPASLPSTSKTVLSKMALDEESKSAFRAPIDDTQDLFSDSDKSDEDVEDSQEDSPVEEVLAPSVLTMNLLLDSAPPDDASSDEEVDDKENIDPHPRKPDGESYPKGDPVKAFVDDEAEEEDDSDNDLARFKENEEDEENEDSEEFNDLIVTGYEEKPSDNVRRDQLHQMWLEQQDAAATDNVLQRLKCGGKQHREPTALEEEEDDDEDYGEDSMDYAADDLPPTSAARINSKKVKQMIPQMFTDKDDVFLSSDDEETEQKLVKMRLLEKAEEHASFLSPAEDENSREVFGLIKKLNIAPDPKKKAKSSSFFDTLITGGNSNSSSRSSFLGRAPSSSLPSSNKTGSSNFRSFIFGRDDSNSRSAITSEGSTDMVENSNQPTRTGSAKFSSSQSKSNSQISSTTKTSSSSSLFEILKRSTHSDHCARDTAIGQSQVAVQFAAFKSEKKSLKIEARN